MPTLTHEFVDATASDSTLRRFLHGLPGVDAVGLEARAASLGTRSIKTTAKAYAIDLAISMIDLTTLEGADTPGKVRALAAKALRPDPTDRTAPTTAALCVYPDMAATAVAALAGSGVKVASVATAFPAGRASLSVKLADTRDAVDAGADEIDMVIDRGAFLAGHYLKVYEEIRAVKEAAGAARLKVIFETGELSTYDNIRRASWLGMIMRRGLHQDVDRQGRGQRDPREHPADAGGRPGLPGADRGPDRREAGGRDPHQQGRDQVPGAGERDRR